MVEGRAEQEVGAPETAQAGRLEAGKGVERTSQAGGALEQKGAQEDRRREVTRR